MPALDITRLPAACFRTPPADAQWTQFDIALVRTAGDARPGARRLFALVESWWAPEYAAGRIPRWFFMRKPPDVRLRFLATPQARPALDALAAVLAREVASGTLAAAAPGRYAPEETRFGGPAALDCAHAWFTLDSVLWRHFEARAAQDLREPAAEIWLAAIFQDLFAAVGARDGWPRLARHVELSSPPAAAPLPGLPTLAALAGEAAPDAATRALAQAYREGNRHFAAALARRALPPGCPAAEVASLTAFFTFNRHGFPGERSRPLVASLLAAQNAS
ncbi:MAG: hypothetical protein HY749_10850 [Gammaproteobacteria bacterium]|nr:hypothetical protein [Gammaproteobacteria bacterium]